MVSIVSLIPNSLPARRRPFPGSLSASRLPLRVHMIHASPRSFPKPVTSHVQSEQCNQNHSMLLHCSSKVGLQYFLSFLSTRSQHHSTVICPAACDNSSSLFDHFFPSPQRLSTLPRGHLSSLFPQFPRTPLDNCPAPCHLVLSINERNPSTSQHFPSTFQQFNGTSGFPFPSASWMTSALHTPGPHSQRLRISAFEIVYLQGRSSSS